MSNDLAACQAAIALCEEEIQRLEISSAAIEGFISMCDERIIEYKGQKQKAIDHQESCLRNIEHHLQAIKIINTINCHPEKKSFNPPNQEQKYLYDVYMSFSSTRRNVEKNAIRNELIEYQNMYCAAQLQWPDLCNLLDRSIQATEIEQQNAFTSLKKVRADCDSQYQTLNLLIRERDVLPYPESLDDQLTRAAAMALGQPHQVTQSSSSWPSWFSPRSLNSQTSAHCGLEMSTANNSLTNSLSSSSASSRCTTPVK